MPGVIARGRLAELHQVSRDYGLVEHQLKPDGTGTVCRRPTALQPSEFIPTPAEVADLVRDCRQCAAELTVNQRPRVRGPGVAHGRPKGLELARRVGYGAGSAVLYLRRFEGPCRLYCELSDPHTHVVAYLRAGRSKNHSSPVDCGAAVTDDAVRRLLNRVEERRAWER